MSIVIIYLSNLTAHSQSRNQIRVGEMRGEEGEELEMGNLGENGKEGEEEEEGDQMVEICIEEGEGGEMDLTQVKYNLRSRP